MENIKLNWKAEMAFDAKIDDMIVPLDAPMDGSEPTGLKPKKLMLVALAGCTGMDVASLVKKMRLDVESLEIDIDAKRTDTTPIVYSEFVINYHFLAPSDQKDKIIKIVNGSQEKYCGVAQMMRKIGPVKYNVYLNSELILSK